MTITNNHSRISNELEDDVVEPVLPTNDDDVELDDDLLLDDDEDLSLDEDDSDSDEEDDEEDDF